MLRRLVISAIPMSAARQAASTARNSDPGVDLERGTETGKLTADIVRPFDALLPRAEFIDAPLAFVEISASEPLPDFCSDPIDWELPVPSGSVFELAVLCRDGKPRVDASARDNLDTNRATRPHATMSSTPCDTRMTSEVTWDKTGDITPVLKKGSSTTLRK